MRDTSIIAQRLSDQYVQYGWGGNGGVCFPTGEILLECCDDPDTVEYLFGLGQPANVWYPHSEESGSVFANRPTGEPHRMGESEREIFSQIAFVDVGYFYDSEPGTMWSRIPFRLKVPLALVGVNLDENKREFAFLTRVELSVLDRVTELCRADPTIGAQLAAKTVLDPVLEELKGELWPIRAFWAKYKTAQEGVYYEAKDTFFSGRKAFPGI